MRAEEIALSAPGGRSVRTLISATPIRSAGGEVESVVFTLQDLAPLEELERLRAEFLGMVSHELRAPLTSIKGSAATVLGASPALDPAEMVQFFRIIDEQADHMRGLIGDLLDAGRIEAGTLSVVPEPAAVAGLVEQARHTFLSGGGRPAVRIDLPPDLPRVVADPQRIVQVLNNLFANASRHSPESSPIDVAAAREGVHVVISVSDQGRGVSPERLPHLFRKHAAGGRREPGAAGSGLGLAICKGLVEAHGGRIWAESGGAGEGTRVAFTIPVAEEAGGEAATEAGAGRAHASGERRGEKRILVVDDDPLALRYARDALTPAGYTTLVTGDPRDVSHLLRTKRPHLVLLDLMLPGIDGIELMQTRPRDGRSAGHLHLRVRTGRNDCQGPGGGSGRLPRQAVLADRADGESPGSPAEGGRAGALPAGRPGHPLRATRSHRGGPPGGADGDRVRAAPRALAQRGLGPDPRCAAAPGVAGTGLCRRASGSRLRQEPAPQAGRRRDAARLHLHRARGRLPHGRTGSGFAAPRATSDFDQYFTSSHEWRHSFTPT